MTHFPTLPRWLCPAAVPILAVSALLSAWAGPVSAQQLPVKPEIDPVKQALAAIQDKEFRTARIAIRLVSDPFQKDALLFRLYRQPGNNASTGEIIAFIEKHPDWPLQKTLRQRVEGAHLGRITDQALIAWFKKNPPTARLGCQRFVAHLTKRGDRPAADDAIVRCWKNLILTADDETKFLQQYKDKLSEKDKAYRVRWHLDRGNRRRADDLLAQLDLPEKRASPLEARIDLQRRPRARTARKLLIRIAKLPTDARIEPGFLLDFTRWNRRRRNLAAAIKTLAVAPNPVTDQARQWWRQRTLVIRRLMNARQWSRAYSVAADHRQSPDNQFANAESLAGWIALRKYRKTAGAKSHFEKILKVARRSDIRAMAHFWTGESWRARKKAPAATDQYKMAASVAFSIYGQMASIRLKAPKLELSKDTVIPTDMQRAFGEEAAVKLVRFFAGKGEIGDSRLMLWWLFNEANATVKNGSTETVKPAALRLVMVAQLAHVLDHRDIALRASRIALGHGAARWALAYPTPRLPDGLPVEAALVLAITRQESEFNVNARSTANAQGLMQLLPSTAKLMAKRAKLEWNSSRLTGDAEYNTRLGAAYLSFLLDRFNRSYLLAAAAYNAGPSRVTRWIRRYGAPGRGISPEDWTESIPYGETRNYVRRVLANVLVYRSLLGGGKLGTTLEKTWRPPAAKDACSVAGQCKKQ